MKVHRTGHYSRTHVGYIISACGRSMEYTQGTEDYDRVECKLCSRLLEKGEELDPITRLSVIGHPSCIAPNGNYFCLGLQNLSGNKIYSVTVPRSEMPEGLVCLNTLIGRNYVMWSAEDKNFFHFEKDMD